MGLLKTSAWCLVFGSLCLLSVHAPAAKLSGSVTALLKYKQATRLGKTNPDKQLSLVIWLKLNHQTALDKLLEELYDSNSVNYHHYLNAQQFNQRFAPSNKALATVQQFLRSHGMKVNYIAAHNRYLKVSGHVADISKAFHVELNDYRYHNKIVYANSKQPFLPDELVQYVSGIAGLNNFPQPHPVKRGQSAPVDKKHFTEANSVCGLGASLEANLVTQNGDVLVPNMNFSNFTICNKGYTAQQIRSAYNAGALPGVDGTGQTIVIVVSCGSPTILEDANAFSTANQLPLLVESGENANFKQVIAPNTPTPICSAEEFSDWSAETTLDVEAAHTIAPHAKIILVLGGTSADLTALEETATYAIDNAPNGGLGFDNANVVSNSWGMPEDTAGTYMDASLQQAMAMGLSVNFGSGDSGDWVDKVSYQTVSYPASSTWATAVGGTSLFLDDNNHYLFETGWGNYVVNTYQEDKYAYLCLTTANPCPAYYLISDIYEFAGGSGGGRSMLYAATSAQQQVISAVYAGGYGIAGTFRYPQDENLMSRFVPDIGMLADSVTGLLIYQTVDNTLTIYNYGGTSLSAPLFSATLALVNQKRAELGKAPLGFAANYLYQLPSNALHVVTPVQGVGNPIPFPPDPLAFQLFSQTSNAQDIQALAVVTFNQDSSLTLGQPWNDIAGVGTPNIPNFVMALANV